MMFLMYIVKASLCMAIILAFYVLVLEKENILKSNRFYLITGLLTAHIIPLIKTPFGLIKEAQPSFKNEPFLSESVIISRPDIITEIESCWSWAQVIIWAYMVIAIILLMRLAYNVLQFRMKRKKYPKIHFEEIPLVLTDLNEAPHSFLKTIYSNKKDYNDGAIKDAVLLHEATHVRQLHSLDVLLISLFQAIGWANPLYHIFRRLIQLNHEYLADQDVILLTHNVLHYQNLLLDSLESHNNIQLASNINFLITKKRLQMMTKKTSRYKAWALRLGSVIVLVSMIFLYGEITGQTLTIPQDEQQVQSQSKNLDNIIDEFIDMIDIQHHKFDELCPIKYPRTSKDEYFKNTTIVYLDGNGKELLRKKYVDLNTKQKNAIPQLPPPPPPADPNEKIAPLQPAPEGTLVYFIMEGTLHFRHEVKKRNELITDIIELKPGSIRIAPPGWPLAFSSNKSELTN